MSSRPGTSTRSRCACRTCSTGSRRRSPDVAVPAGDQDRGREIPARRARGRRATSAVYCGQKTYNGVAILSRDAAREVAPAFPASPTSRSASSPRRSTACASCASTPRTARRSGSDKYEYKLRWFAALARWLKDELARQPRLAVLGDFNVAPEDRDVHDPKRWEGQIHVSEPERARAARAFSTLGLKDAFRLFEQPEKTFSWWDYRMMAFRAQLGPAHRPRPALAGSLPRAAPPARSTRRRASSSGPRTTPR